MTGHNLVGRLTMSCGVRGPLLRTFYSQIIVRGNGIYSEVQVQQLYSTCFLVSSLPYSSVKVQPPSRDR